jgi:hypothetical protein
MSTAEVAPSINWDGSFHSYRPSHDWAARLSPNVEFLDPGDLEVDPIAYEVLR